MFQNSDAQWFGWCSFLGALGSSQKRLLKLHGLAQESDNIRLGNNMAKESCDRITNDLFANEIRPGRPKSNPHSRQVQLKINKQRQILRDKQKGLKRIELKVDSDLFDRLNQLSKEQDISRAELINKLLQAQLN